MGVAVNEIQCFTESKGGLKFDVLLSESPGKKAKKIAASPMRKDLSLSEIEYKLEAAEQRRLSQQFKEKDLRSRRLSHVIEVQKNKNIFIKKFKTKALESYIRKMLSTGRNREAYLKSIQKKNRDLLLRVKEIKNTTLFLRESHFDSFCKKLEVDEQARKAQFQVFEDEFRKLNMRLEQVHSEVVNLYVVHSGFLANTSALLDVGKKQGERIDRLASQMYFLTDLLQKLQLH